LYNAYLLSAIYMPSSGKYWHNSIQVSLTARPDRSGRRQRKDEINYLAPYIDNFHF